jgi:hypothetical protein
MPTSKRIIQTFLFVTASYAILYFAFAGSTSAMPKRYTLLSWNDLGMHCYNRNFQDLAVLPPFNTLWAQVIEVGDPPRIVTSLDSHVSLFT